MKFPTTRFVGNFYPSKNVLFIEKKKKNPTFKTCVV
jgi:hypothetical protein